MASDGKRKNGSHRKLIISYHWHVVYFYLSRDVHPFHTLGILRGDFTLPVQTPLKIVDRNLRRRVRVGQW